MTRSKELFRWIEEGKVKVSEPTTFASRDGQEDSPISRKPKKYGWKILLLP